MALPYLAVLRDKFISGANSLDGDAEALPTVPMRDAFLAHYSTDAHFLTYRISDAAETFPRLNKPVLGSIRAAGADVVTEMLVLDWDNPGHAPWASPQAFDEWLSRLLAIDARWSLCYATRGGARVVYVLDRPVPVDQSEGIHQGLVAQLAAKGFQFDKNVWDWTRCFRLPFVTRDGVADFSAPLVDMWDNRISPDSIPSMGTSPVKEYGPIIPVDDPEPTADEAFALMWLATGKPSEYRGRAKIRLRGRECFPCIFEHAPVAEPGDRDNTIHSHVGQLVSCLYKTNGTTPAHIYALLYEAVVQLGPEWPAILWSSVRRLWAKEAARVGKIETVKAEVTKQAEDDLDVIVEGMRKWTQLPDDPDEARTFAQRHLICGVSKYYFLMDMDGKYNPAPVEANHLTAAIRARGLDRLMQTSLQSDKGTISDRPIQQIINEYATIAQEIESSPRDTAGGIVDHLDTVNAVLRMSCYARNPKLTPLYNADVDTWLGHLFGRHYDTAMRWIAYSLAFEEGPICALSLKGPPGIGKGLLTLGLAECLVRPVVATGEDIVKEFNYGLLKSPYLCVNEGWPQAGKGRHPADQFRSLVAGDPIIINRKFMAPVHASNPVRIIFTANNNDVIQKLSHGRELSPEDREALAIRLLHFDLPTDGGDWLRQQGGIALTGKPGARWVHAVGSGSSDFILARHLLWLHSQRHELGKPGARFLVEGNQDEEVMMALRTQAGSSPLVIEVLLRMLELNKPWDGLAVVGGKLYALASEVLEFYRNNIPGHGKGITIDQIAKVFRGLAVHEASEVFVLKGRERMGPRRWCELDCHILLEVAKKDGWKYGKLQEIIDLRKKDLTGGDVIGKIGVA